MHSKDYFVLILATIALSLSVAAMIFSNNIDSKVQQNDSKLKDMEQKLDTQSKSFADMTETLKPPKKGKVDTDISSPEISSGLSFLKRELEKEFSKKFKKEDIIKDIIAELEKSGSESDKSLLDPKNIKKLESLIEKKVGEKLQEVDPQDRKIDLTTLSEKINLDKSQEDALADELNKAKDEAFEVAKIPRFDGTTFLDEVVEAFKDQENAPERIQKVFQKLFVEKVPGTDETYFVRIMKINESTMSTMKLILNGEQYKKYQRMGVQPLDIKTGYEPFENYIAELLSQNK